MLLQSTLSFNSFLLVWFTLLHFLAANDATVSTPSITILSIVTGFLLILIGLLFLLAGKRILKFIIFLAAAILFAYLTFCAANAIIDYSLASNNQKIGIYIAMGILGLLGGFLAICIWKFGLIILGGAMGVSLGSMLIRTNVISSHTGQLILLIGFAAVFAILTCIFSNILVIIATSIFGGYSVMSGIECFVQVGFDGIISNIGKSGASVPVTGPVWAMLVSVLVLAIIGIMVQFRTQTK